MSTTSNYFYLSGDILSSDGESKLAKIVGFPPFPDSLDGLVAINESLTGQLIEKLAFIVLRIYRI
jgi:hypothetical protein